MWKKWTKSKNSINTVTNSPCVNNGSPRKQLVINTQSGIACTLILKDAADTQDALFYQQQIQNGFNNGNDLYTAWTEVFELADKIILWNNELELKTWEQEMVTRIWNQIREKFNIPFEEKLNKRMELLIEEISIIVSNINIKDNNLIDELIDYAFLKALKKWLIYWYITQNDVQNLYKSQDSFISMMINDYGSSIDKSGDKKKIEMEKIKQSFVSKNYNEYAPSLDDIKKVEKEKWIKMSLNRDLSKVAVNYNDFDDEKLKEKASKIVGIKRDLNTVKSVSEIVWKNWNGNDRTPSVVFQIVKYIDLSLNDQQLYDYIKSIICTIYNVDDLDDSIVDSLAKELKKNVLNYVYDSKNPIFKGASGASLVKYLDRDNCNFSTEDKKQINQWIEQRVKLSLIKSIQDVFGIKKGIAEHISGVPSKYDNDIVRKIFSDENIDSYTKNNEENLDNLEIEFAPELFELYRLFLKYWLTKHWEEFKERFFKAFNKHFNKKVWKPIEKEIIGDNTKLQSEMRKIFDKYGWDTDANDSIDTTIVRDSIKNWINSDKEYLLKVLNLKPEILLWLYNKLKMKNLLGTKCNKKRCELMENIGDITNISKVKDFIWKKFENRKYLTEDFIDKFPDETTSVLLECINWWWDEDSKKNNIIWLNNENWCKYRDEFDFINEVLTKANENAKNEWDWKKFLDILTSPFCKRGNFDHFKYDIKFERENDLKHFYGCIKELQSSPQLKLYTWIKTCIWNELNRTDWAKNIHERCINGDCIKISDKARLLTKWDEDNNTCYIRFYISSDEHDTQYYSDCLNTKFSTSKLAA